MVVLDMEKIITCEKCKARTVVELSENTVRGVSKCSKCRVMVSYSEANTEDTRCINCKYFYIAMFCRRYPPQVTETGSKFPMVHWDDWCQEYSLD